MKRLLLCLSILAITVGLYATDEPRVTGLLTIDDDEPIGIYVDGYDNSTREVRPGYTEPGS